MSFGNHLEPTGDVEFQQKEGKQAQQSWALLLGFGPSEHSPEVITSLYACLQLKIVQCAAYFLSSYICDTVLLLWFLFHLIVTHILCTKKPRETTSQTSSGCLRAKRGSPTINISDPTTQEKLSEITRVNTPDPGWFWMWVTGWTGSPVPCPSPQPWLSIKFYEMWQFPARKFYGNGLYDFMFEFWIPYFTIKSML